VPDPERILIIRPSALGDIVRTVPVLAALRARYPDAQIDWMVRDTFVDAVTPHPALDGVVPFARAALGRQTRRGRFGDLRRWLGVLRRTRYDAVLDCQGLFRSGFFSFATGAARRIGYRDASEFSWIFHNERIPAPRAMHTVDRALALAAACGADTSEPDLTLYAQDEERSQAVIEYPEPYAVLAPTSAWPAKCWPIDRFVELAKHLADHPALGRIIIVGGPGERLHCAPLLELAERHPRITDRVGSTSIALLMAIIERAKLVVANDSAPLHMAVGFKRPLVALLGPTDPKLACPYGRADDVIQHTEPGDEFYFRDARAADMITRITVDEVAAACDARLG